MVATIQSPASYESEHGKSYAVFAVFVNKAPVCVLEKVAEAALSSADWAQNPSNPLVGSGHWKLIIRFRSCRVLLKPTKLQCWVNEYLIVRYCGSCTVKANSIPHSNIIISGLNNYYIEDDTHGTDADGFQFGNCTIATVLTYNWISLFSITKVTIALNQRVHSQYS